MNHLYRVETGELVSSTSLPITSIPTGMAVKASVLTGIWNIETLDFDPIPAKRVITREVFTERMGFARFKALKAVARLDETGELADGVEYMMGLGNVNLDDPDLVRIFQQLVDAGVWTTEDVQEILGV